MMSGETEDKLEDDAKTVPAYAPWRSLLFVPITRDRFVEKAKGSQADAIILDLEDAVLEEHKARARAMVGETAARLCRRGVDVLVRINRPLSLAIPDIESSVDPNVIAVVASKTSSAEHLRLLAELIEEVELRRGVPVGQTKIVPLIETADAVRRMDEIASSPRVVGICCGDEDLAADIGCATDSETLVAVKQRLVLAAVTAGCRPLGLMGSITEYRDLGRFRSFARRSWEAGLKGSLCIHPAQTEIVNEEFGPSMKEVMEARRVVGAAQEAQRAGLATTGLDGSMIDAPVIRRANEVLRLHSFNIERENARGANAS